MNDDTASIIRPSRLSDAASIARIHVDAWRQAYAGIVSHEFLAKMDYEERTRRWQSNLTDGKALTIVKERGNVISGWASYGPSRDEDFHGTEIWAIYVSPDSWGKGVGRSLFEFIHSDPSCTNQSTVWVLKENQRAQSFYRSMGYVPDGMEKTVEIGSDSLLEVRYLRSC